MKKFKIEVEEILQKVIEVEAKDLDDAIDKAMEIYGCGYVELDFNDLKETNYRRFIEE